MLSLRLFFLSFAALGGKMALAKRMQVHDQSFAPDYVLRVSYAETAIACRSRYSAVVNGSTPGPEVRLQENRTTWIRVYNDFETENLTMHWHGLSQSTAPFSDGTPQVSQWPIPVGHYFDYEIRPRIGDAGTYFYHSHVNFQAVSAAGPIIVEEASRCPPYQYDEERIFFVTELYRKTDADIVAGLTAPIADFVWSNETEQLLVNGKSFVPSGDNQSGPSGNATSSCLPEVFRVRPSTTYRFRSVGSVALSLVSYMFEDHDNLTVIAADGAYTKPADASGRIQIDSGQRFDYLLTTKSEAELRRLNKTDFWIQLESRYRPTNVTSYALLSYVGCSFCQESTVPTAPPATPPLSLTNDIQGWLEYTLEPLTPNDFPSASEVSRTVVLRSAQISFRNALLWTVANHSWTEANEHLGYTPTNSTSSNTGTPYLVDIYRNGQSAIPDFDQARRNNGWDAQRNVYVGQIGEVIDIVLYNSPDGAAGGFDVHPWHIHGGHVYDLGSGPGQYNATLNEQRLRGYNPVLRDTTILYKYTPDDGVGTLAPYSLQGWRAWRLRIQDAGVWMVHCHTLQHMIMGMQTVWVMGDAADITASSEPYVDGYLEYGGSAYGNASFDPLVLHYFD